MTLRKRKKKLQSLKELRREVLLPLLRSPGFSDGYVANRSILSGLHPARIATQMNTRLLMVVLTVFASAWVTQSQTTLRARVSVSGKSQQIATHGCPERL